MKHFLIFLLCLTVWSAKGQADGFKRLTEPRQVEQKLIQASRGVTSITSDFIQEKHLEYLSTVVKSKGKFWFKQPAVIRWEYLEPYKYLIIINNGKINIQDEDKKSAFDVNSNKAFKELNDIIVSSMNGTLIASEKYDLSIFENPEFWRVNLIPKSGQMQKVLKQIELYFLKTDLSVKKIKMVESAQDYTLITLLNKKVNTAIPASVFDLK